MSPDDQVSVREFEREHAELREDIAAVKKENGEKFDALEAKVEAGFKELSKDIRRVVTWPQLAVLAPILLAAIALIVKS